MCLKIRSLAQLSLNKLAICLKIRSPAQFILNKLVICLKIRSPAQIIMNKRGSLFQNRYSDTACTIMAMCLKIRSPTPVFLRNKQDSLFENTFSRLSCIHLAICLKIRSPAPVSLNKPAICLFVNSFSPNYWRKRMRSVRARQTDAAGGKYVLLLCIHSTPIQSIQTHRSFNSFNYSTFIECFLLAVAQPTEAS